MMDLRPFPEEKVSPEIVASLLAQALTEGQKQAELFMKAFVIYIGIHGIILKAWLDVDTQSDLYIRYICSAAGISVSLLVCYVWPAWIQMRNILANDIARLNELILSPLKSTDLIPLKHITTTSGLFAILTFIWWAVLIWFGEVGLEPVSAK